MRKRRIILSIMMVLLVLTMATTSVFATITGTLGTYSNATETVAYQGADLCKKASAEGKAKEGSTTSVRFTVGYGTGTNMKSAPITLSNVYQSRSYGWVANTNNYTPYVRSYKTYDTSKSELIAFVFI